MKRARTVPIVRLYPIRTLNAILPIIVSDSLLDCLVVGLSGLMIGFEGGMLLLGNVMLVALCIR